jgi:hypothetical protein
MFKRQVIGATFRFAYFLASKCRFSIDTALGSELTDALVSGEYSPHDDAHEVFARAPSVLPDATGAPVGIHESRRTQVVLHLRKSSHFYFGGL